jgi:hypothetical protein
MSRSNKLWEVRGAKPPEAKVHDPAEPIIILLGEAGS